MTWSFQLYSARNFQPWPGVFEKLQAIGYRQVEGFGGLYADPAALRKQLDDAGLAMPTGHFGIDLLEGDFGRVLDIAGTLGIRLVACPHLAAELRPADATGWRRFGERLAAIGDKAEQAGLQFAWHNHDFEFQPLDDGTVPQQHILDAAPEIGWEMDVAWVVRGGADPKEWVGRYGDRIVAVHVKDIAPSGEALDEDGWADVGHGTLDWKNLHALLKRETPAGYFVMEHDNPSNFERFARRSLEAAQSF